jgi:hypothetical protein
MIPLLLFAIRNSGDGGGGDGKTREKKEIFKNSSHSAAEKYFLPPTDRLGRPENMLG